MVKRPSAPPSALAPEVLVVDDEHGIREVLRVTLSRHGWSVTTASGAKLAKEHLAQNATPFPLVLTDLMMPDGSGLDVLDAARTRSPGTQVIVITAHSSMEAAIDAMKRGAYDFVAKPFSPAEIAALAQKALEKSDILEENTRLKARLASITPPPRALFGEGPAMRRVNTLVEKAARTRTTVLITGESGTGKGRVARALHDRGDRATGPFAVVNCGALPEALIESELFGHEKGAFTGAVHASPGMFRVADGGTLFLDEVGELPQPVQVKLLRALQERTVRPVGGTREIPVDVRVVAATNRSIDEDVEEGRFRKDLYYRLNIIRIDVPPLREREGRVGALATEMIARFDRDLGRAPRRLSPEAQRALERYAFPGNIRELENMMERAAALCGTDRIELADLPPAVGQPSRRPPSPLMLPEDGCDLDATLATVERRLIEQALRRAGGVRTGAAKLLGVTFRSLRYRLQKLDIAVEDGDDGDAKVSEPG